MFIFNYLSDGARLKLKAVLAVVMTTSVLQSQVLVSSQYVVEMDKSLNDNGKALTGHAFRNLTMKNIVECLFACLDDCLCMAFQMCKNTECQLLSSNQFQSPSSLVSMKECSYFDMVPKQVGQTSPTQCTPRCECCVNPCQNGGSCESFFPTDYTTPRFKCNCSPGYAGDYCEDVVKSCRGYINGSRISGIYKVFHQNMNLFEVFCDFDSNSTMAWTLVQSHQLQNKGSFIQGLGVNYPVNEETPRWDAYRLSKPKMESIQQDSVKWRITCKYDTDGVVYRDYLQATNNQLDIITFNNQPLCPLVEWIDVRGQSCKQCTAFIVQSNSIILHGDSYASKGCDFQPTGSKTCGEDNFGFYGCINSAHRCSSSQSATTQIWFGSH